MGRLIATWWFAVGVPVGLLAEDELTLRRFEFTQVEMAVPIRIVLYAKDGETASRQARAAFARFAALNAVMSDYDPDSELNRLCRTAGEGKSVPVSADLWRVLEQAQQVSAASGGAFDVTVGPVVRLWRRARRRRELPTTEQIAAARQLVDYRLVRLDAPRRAVELLKPGMQLDLGGIAKGYAVDEALAVLRKGGAPRALVDAGGDLGLGDPPPGQVGWRVGLTALDGGKPTQYLIASRTAVSTSGDNVQFLEIGGRRYSHVVDPRTGMGLTDHCRVTLVAPSGMLADAYTKAIGVLGPKRGIELIEKVPHAAALVLRAPDGKLERQQSSGWKDLHIEEAGPERPRGGRSGD